MVLFIFYVIYTIILYATTTTTSIKIWIKTKGKYFIIILIKGSFYISYYIYIGRYLFVDLDIISKNYYKIGQNLSFIFLYDFFLGV